MRGERNVFINKFGADWCVNFCGGEIHVKLWSGSDGSYGYRPVTGRWKQWHVSRVISKAVGHLFFQPRGWRNWPVYWN